MPKAIVILAEGFEEVEAIAPIDMLRRANLEVIVAGLSGTTVTSSRKVRIQADCLLSEVRDLAEVLVLPGGMPGSKNLAESHLVCDLVKKHLAGNKLVAAICAAPALVLAEACQVVRGKKVCGFPGTEEKLAAAGGLVQMEAVVWDQNLITARAAGTAMLFGLKIVEALVGANEAERIGKATLLF